MSSGPGGCLGMSWLSVPHTSPTLFVLVSFTGYLTGLTGLTGFPNFVCSKMLLVRTKIGNGVNAVNGVKSSLVWFVSRR
jgi:hypothetical protein